LKDVGSPPFGPGVQGEVTARGLRWSDVDGSCLRHRRGHYPRKCVSGTSFWNPMLVGSGLLRGALIFFRVAPLLVFFCLPLQYPQIMVEKKNCLVEKHG